MIDGNILKNIRKHYDSYAKERHQWIRKNKYYHGQMLKYYSFLVPEGSRVLELGCGIGYIIGSLKPSYGVGVDFSGETIKAARKSYPGIKFVCSAYEDFSTKEKFDYIIISGILSITNMQKLLQNIKKSCNPDTRIIICEYNRIWSPLLRLSEKLRLKMPEVKINELAVKDIENIININGYQLIKRDKFGLMPKYIPILSAFFNKVLAKLPLINSLCLNQFLIFRLNEAPKDAKKVSVFLTCKDEEGNIEELVKRTPSMGGHTELVFVEGGSKDNTYGKIQEMIKKYPKKDIKLLKQKGIGPKDAIYTGFGHSKGDFIILLEADLTTPPEEISYVWDIYKKGYGEYVQGSRLVYRMNKKAMPKLNYFGNGMFAKIFTWIVGQRFTDTLSGVKAMSKERYRQFEKQKNFFRDLDPFGDFEMIFWCMKNNLKLVEVPITYLPRKYGETKIKAVKHGWMLLKISLKAMKLFKFRV